MQTDRGLTLVEVLVAMVVFSVALLELGRMQIIASHVSSAAARLSRATALAQDKIEQLMAVAYDHALLADLTPVGQTTVYTDPNPPQGYTVRWSVDADTPRAEVKTVNVVVEWKNRGKGQNAQGSPKDFQLVFYKYREGL